MTTHVLIGSKGYIAGPVTLREAWRRIAYLTLTMDQYIVIMEARKCSAPAATPAAIAAAESPPISCASAPATPTPSASTPD